MCLSDLPDLPSSTLAPQVDPVTADMLKSINLTATVASITIQQVGPPKPAFQQGAPFQGGGRGKQ